VKTVTQSGIILYGVLAVVVVCGATVSLSTKPRTRRFRNIALLFAYLLGIATLYVVPLLWAITIWIGAGIVVGFVCAVVELWFTCRNPSEEIKPRFRIWDLAWGPLAWPQMSMEVIENTYVELRGSKSPPLPSADKH
jgi:hypothetical protein